MKRWIVILLSLFLLAGCLGFIVAEPSLYSVTTADYKDIQGDFSIDSFLLYKLAHSGGKTTVEINRYRPITKAVFYDITIRFIGPDWRFMKTIYLKVDDKLFTYNDRAPYRKVISGGIVMESIHALFDPEILASFKNASALQVQYFADPVTIPVEGISALKVFLAE